MINRLLILSILLVAFLSAPAVPAIASNRVNVSVQIAPEQTIVINELDDIVLVTNPGQPAERTVVRRSSVSGERVEMTYRVQQQYEELAAAYDLTKEGVVYERQHSNLEQIGIKVAGWFYRLFASA